MCGKSALRVGDLDGLGLTVLDGIDLEDPDGINPEVDRDPRSTMRGRWDVVEMGIGEDVVVLGKGTSILEVLEGSGGLVVVDG